VADTRPWEGVGSEKLPLPGEVGGPDVDRLPLLAEESRGSLPARLVR